MKHRVPKLDAKNPVLLSDRYIASRSLSDIDEYVSNSSFKRYSSRRLFKVFVLTLRSLAIFFQEKCRDRRYSCSILSQEFEIYQAHTDNEQLVLSMLHQHNPLGCSALSS